MAARASSASSGPTSPRRTSASSAPAASTPPGSSAPPARRSAGTAATPQTSASRTTLDTQLNVFADFSPKIPAAYRTSPFVLLGNIHPSLQVDVVEQVQRPKLVAADTMNFWISGEPAALAEMLKRIDLLIINDEEARELSGIHNLVRAAADIRKRGPKALVIKRGEFGALLFDEAGDVLRAGLPARGGARPDRRGRLVRRRAPRLPRVTRRGVAGRRSARRCSSPRRSGASASRASGRRASSR